MQAAEFQLDAQQIAYYQSGTENARVHLLIELINNKHADMAEALLKRFPLEGPLAENRTLFLDGMILESRNQFPAAAAKFRAALANDPRLTLVRMELAKVLARMDETDSAKHHLELLEGELDDPTQRASIRSFIDSINASHPFSFSGFISIAPSTNINQGSSHTTVYSPGMGGVGGVDPLGTIDPSSQKQSGIGLTAGGSVGYAKSLSKSLQAVFAANIATTYYPNLETASFGLSQSAEIRHLDPGGYFGFGAVASQGVDPGALDLSHQDFGLAYVSYGPRVSFLRRLSQRDQLTGSATYEWRKYPDSDSADGRAITVSAILTHALDASANVALIGGYENVDQQLDFNSYQDFTIGGGFYKELHHGLTVQGQATARFANFEAENPFTLSTRQDKYLVGSLTFIKRDWNWFGFAPSLNYTYVRNFSNIELYDFDSHSVDFRLTKDF